MTNENAALVAAEARIAILKLELEAVDERYDQLRYYTNDRGGPTMPEDQRQAEIAACEMRNNELGDLLRTAQQEAWAATPPLGDMRVT